MPYSILTAMFPNAQDTDLPDTRTQRSERWSRRDIYAILSLLFGAIALAVGSKVYVIVQDNSRLEAALNNRTTEIAHLREDVAALKTQLSRTVSTPDEAKAQPSQPPASQSAPEAPVTTAQPAQVVSSSSADEPKRPIPAIQDVTQGRYDGELAPCEQRHLCLKHSGGTIIRTKVGDGYRLQMWSWKRNIEIEYLAEGMQYGEPVRFEIADGYLRRIVLFDR